jgi:hypothetical protein
LISAEKQIKGIPADMTGKPVFVVSVFSFKRGIYIWIFICLVLLPGTLMSQTDTTAIKKHSPVRATVYSAVIPGLGQIYNRKYWKVPIVYGGMGTCIYFTVFSQKRYNEFRDAWRALNESNPNGTVMFDGYLYTLNGLDAGRNYYRRNRDLFTIFTAGVYILNIVDANVDAHLFDFDVSDDLTFNLRPALIPVASTSAISPGLTMKITWR